MHIHLYNCKMGEDNYKKINKVQCYLQLHNTDYLTNK